MQAIAAMELAAWLADASRPRPLLLDVREPWEHAICLIEGSLALPMRAVPERLADLDDQRPVVCICHGGVRSAHVAMFLERQGRTEVYNLTGGIDAWARQVDPAMPVY